MGNTWEGCRVSNRLNLWYDDDMQHWTLSGREENNNATGTAGEMVRLAITVLEHLTDTGENGPPMDPEEEHALLPPAPAHVLELAVDLARNRTGGMTDEQYDRFAGALMAVAVHMLQAGQDKKWTLCRDPRFPFRMETGASP